MRPLTAGCLLALCLFLAAPSLQAHHGGGGGGLGASQSVLQLLYPPRSNLYYNFRFNTLRADQGYSILNEFGGEYAFLSRFSLGLSVPLWSSDDVLLPAVTRLGDLTLLFKGEIWESRRLRMQWMGGLNTGFPTGNDQVSLGAGAVTFTPYFTYLLDRDAFDFFLNLETLFEISGAVNPTLSFETGFIVPIGAGGIPVSLLVSFRGEDFIAGDTFTAGSFKGYLVAGFILDISENWQMALQGRVSVVDALTIKPDIQFNDLATGLFADVKGTFGLNLGYEF